MLRVAQHVLGRAGLDDPAEVHHRDPVGDVPRQAEVVGDDEYAETELAAQGEQQREDLAADRGIERGDRFVGDEQLGRHRQGAGDQHPLPLPARQLVGVAQEQALGRPEPGRRQRGGDELGLRPALCPISLSVVRDETVQPDALGDGVVDRVPGVQGTGRVLQHQLHSAPERLEPAGGPVERLAVEEHLARGWRLQSEQRPGQRGLARPRLPHQRHDLARR